MEEKKDGFWRRVMHKYRLAMVDESNLNELSMQELTSMKC